MKFASYLPLLSATSALAAPLDSRAGGINFVVGQNYIDEWDAFKSALVMPAGISTYGDIWSGALNSDSQTLLSTYAALTGRVHDIQCCDTTPDVEIVALWKLE